MSNNVAVTLALLIGLFVAADLAFGWGGTLSAARRLADLVDALAFWRSATGG